MFYDGLNLFEGSKITNCVIESATSFPSTPNVAELFYRSDELKLYVYNGTGWVEVGAGSSGPISIVVSGDVTGTLNDSSGTLTLATVNSSPVSNSFRKITVTSKGLVTDTSAVSLADITGALGYTPVDKAGDTLTGPLILSADPTALLGAATKQYVDNVASGMNVHQAVRAATTGNLSATYSNGAAGVGATLTGTGALPSIDDVSLAVNDRVLVRGQTAQTQNGIYQVTTLSPNWVLTRTADFDNSPANEVVAGDAVYVQEGTSYGGQQWVQTTTGSITIGTSNIVFTQFGGPGTYVNGTGISISANTISNTGVTSLAGTTNQVNVSASTGSVTLSLPSSVTISGTMTAGSFFDGSGIEIGWKLLPRSSTTGTLTLNDRSKVVSATAAIEVPASIFPEGAVVSIYNNSASSITITQGAGLTMRLVGTAATGNRTLAQRGFVTLWFHSTSECVISGGGLS